LIAVTLSATLSDCLADVGIDTSQLARYVYRRGFARRRGNMSLQVVLNEVNYVIAHSACTFQDADFKVFWRWVFRRLRRANRANFHALKIEVARLVIPPGITPFWRMP
jgi:hypothetical protein